MRELSRFKVDQRCKSKLEGRLRTKQCKCFCALPASALAGLCFSLPVLAFSMTLPLSCKHSELACMRARSALCLRLLWPSCVAACVLACVHAPACCTPALEAWSGQRARWRQVAMRRDRGGHFAGDARTDQGRGKGSQYLLCIQVFVNLSRHRGEVRGNMPCIVWKASSRISPALGSSFQMNCSAQPLRYLFVPLSSFKIRGWHFNAATCLMCSHACRRPRCMCQFSITASSPCSCNLLHCFVTWLALRSLTVDVGGGWDVGGGSLSLS